jgi:hypothetical protein
MEAETLHQNESCDRYAWGVILGTGMLFPDKKLAAYLL